MSVFSLVNTPTSSDQCHGFKLMGPQIRAELRIDHVSTTNRRRIAESSYGFPEARNEVSFCVRQILKRGPDIFLVANLYVIIGALGISKLSKIITRWWFQIFFMFTSTWGNDPVWLIFFRWVGSTTNQLWSLFHLNFGDIQVSYGMEKREYPTVWSPKKSSAKLVVESSCKEIR